MTVAYETNCAGQGCPDSDGCRRFQMRMATKETRGTESPAFEWASFDLERSTLGDCPNFVRFHERTH